MNVKNIGGLILTNKYTKWYDNQNETTKAWLDAQALWHDRDMVLCGCVCFLIGLFFGFFI